MTTGHGETIIVEIILVVEWLLGVLSVLEQSDLGTFTRGLRLVARWVNGVVVNVHIGVDHYGQHLHGQLVFVRLNILPFDYLSDLLFKALLVLCDIQL